MIDLLEVAMKALSVAALALLCSTVIGAAVGTVLAERRRGYRLPFEQTSNVRIIRPDEGEVA